MTTYTRQFLNELGHSISIRVSEKSINGVPAILLYMAGPDSDTEMEVTRQEAVELMEGLRRVMKPARR